MKKNLDYKTGYCRFQKIIVNLGYFSHCSYQTYETEHKIESNG